MVIAVDFDGTIVEHRYPRIGEEIPFAIDTLKLLQQEKHRLILWSVREGALLDEAVEWCKARGLEFYAINKDYPEEQKDHQGFSRKLKADLLSMTGILAAYRIGELSTKWLRKKKHLPIYIAKTKKIQHH